ncbi:manganese-stabilising protein / photosystem II polypeptide [Rubidibacter lacunae KORDI 51-2]|uniref:Photosystem II extrinsic protein O n=1 Tax=Rubidibacter lacunae KORDI 51-2 TaxID=582515 RepID=U5DE27_9CHRO|nr:photosystem II manganese-stabilizing polypeptide [Rubidibacter lacunae]ERN39876.1 manganese-stabilising protein / photosystem II polypeptide [Rubidibacter lacunae KORDI 51-2]
MSYRAFIVALLAVCLGILTACSEAPSELVDKSQLTYDQVLGTGLANTCPQLVQTSRGSIPIGPGQTYRLVDMCLQPTEFYIEEEPANSRREPEFVPGKLLTRATSTLDQIDGTLKVDDDGRLTFFERGGIDFQPITVLLPGGEQVPFLFTIKNLVAKAGADQAVINTSTDLRGEFNVPSYRGAVFLDPKGRGVASGYDNAVALPAQADIDDLERANVKRVDRGTGDISLQVQRVNSDTGEIAGTFESEQPSDTDLGAQEPEAVKIRGIFYAVLEDSSFES